LADTVARAWDSWRTNLRSYADSPTWRSFKERHHNHETAPAEHRTLVSGLSRHRRQGRTVRRQSTSTCACSRGQCRRPGIGLRASSSVPQKATLLAPSVNLQIGFDQQNTAPGPISQFPGLPRITVTAKASRYLTHNHTLAFRQPSENTLLGLQRDQEIPKNPCCKMMHGKRWSDQPEPNARPFDARTEPRQ